MVLKRYKAAKGLAEVGGVKVVRGYVKMSEDKALYHVSLGRLSLPKSSKKTLSETEES